MRKQLLKQIIAFLLVGGIAFAIDYVFLYIFTECLSINYLVSSIFSFILSVICNYILSVKFVFKTKEDLSRKKEFVLFLILSIIGLGINALIMYIGTDIFGIYFMFTKIISTGIVMVYNFISRKLILERKD